MVRKFDIMPVHAGTLLGEQQLHAIIGDYLEALETLGATRVDDIAPPADPRPLVFLVATGGSEKVILNAWTERRRAAPDEPLLLIAHPRNNSLPAALEVLARLQQDGNTGRIFYLSRPDDQDGLDELADALHDLSVRRALRKARVGLVGIPSDWLVASMPDAETVRETWGPTVVKIEMDDVVSEVEGVSTDDAVSHVDELVSSASEVCEPTISELQDVARVYRALARIVEDHRLDALTVRCFDFVEQLRTTSCFALAQLTDAGVIAGCEGDLVSTVGLLWAQKLLGVTPWMANPAQLDPAGNRLCLAHCTVPRSLVEDYRLRSHFESGLGVGIQGTLPTGPVTVFRIGGRKLERLWLAEGEILRAGDAENLCRTQVEIRLDRGGAVTDLLRAPLGNHLVLIFGRHFDRLRAWCEGTGIELVVSEAH
jgi:L-fucose isomerase-like protein